MSEFNDMANAVMKLTQKVWGATRQRPELIIFVDTDFFVRIASQLPTHASADELLFVRDRGFMGHKVFRVHDLGIPYVIHCKNPSVESICLRAGEQLTDGNKLGAFPL